MERKIVKLRVDMYNDTKFKIIDTMEERDLIHYIWTRLLTLAGKVNLEGALYLSKSIPYTIETLALEFNRSAKKVELALKVFMDLEMVESGENNVYKVRNFAKHQNIKPKKKEDFKDKEEERNDKFKNVHNNVDNIESDVNKFDEFDCIIGNQRIENEGDNCSLESLDNVGDGTCENISNLNIEKHDEDKTTLNKSKDASTTEVLKSKISTVNKKNVQNLDKECITENKSNNKQFVVNNDNEKEVTNSHNNIKIVNFNNDKKDFTYEIESIKAKDNLEIQSKNILDKIELDKKAMLNKPNKTRSKPNTKNKSNSKKFDDEIICSCDQDGDDIEICDFTGEIPKGNLIANFEF
ncbi:hypothetical protein FDB39_00830 [Clostridium botulinum]|nr:hypothetical protein [Clostridium botulinum]